MFSFLNLSFDFTEGSSSSSRSVSKAEPSKLWTWESTSSPMTSTATLTPRTEPFFTPPPAKKPLESPDARAAEICPAPGAKKRQSARHKQRRSSVFFKLPDLDKVLKGDKSPPTGEGAGGKKKKDDGSGGGHDNNTMASKFSRAGSSRRRSRRASIAPGGCSPGRTRADREAAAAAAAAEERSRDLDFPPSPIGAAAAAAAAAAGEPISGYQRSKPSRRGTLLVTVGEDGPAPEGGGGASAAVQRQDHPEDMPQRRPSPRSSPRALSAGHR